jgi:hypothetical protein
VKVQAHFKQFKNFLEQLPKGYNVKSEYVEDYNSMVDAAAEDLSQDLSRFKIVGPPDEHYNDESWYRDAALRLKLGRIIGYLDGEFSLEDTTTIDGQTGIAVSVINNNTIAVTINQSIQQLIDSSSNDEVKEKLAELQEELRKPEKDWSKIKSILKWALDFSEKLFFQLLPIILKQYGVSL